MTAAITLKEAAARQSCESLVAAVAEMALEARLDRLEAKGRHIDEVLEGNARLG